MTLNHKEINAIKQPISMATVRNHLCIVLILVLFLATVFVSCTRDFSTGPHIAAWQVRGMVIDSIDGSAIPLVRVSVGDSLTSSNGFFTSDSSGAYVVFLFAPGRHLLLSRKSGYVTKAITVEIGAEEFITDSIIFELARE